jgi:hypothetical protein
VGVRALAGEGGVVYAAAAPGLLVARPLAAAAGEARAAAPPLELPADPAIALVHRAAVSHLRLGVDRLDALHDGVTNRGWLPIVALHGGWGADEAWATTHDEAVNGGALWSLVDRDRDRGSDYEIGVTLSWDLGDVAYHPEQIDVSHETREVIELRDDVLDEITQLYFERRRVLAELASLPDPAGPDALRLRLRADELAAGIDAWTGGWFGRRAPALASGAHSSPRAGGN